MNKLVISVAVMALGAMTAQALEVAPLYSPDSLTVVTVADYHGKPAYSVTYNGTPFVMASPLGLDTNLGDFTMGVKLSKATDSQRISNSYSLPNIKRSHVNYEANSATYTFSKEGSPVFDVIFQVSNNNVAFRYMLYPKRDTRCAIINRELSGFILPEGTTTFMAPMSKPMGGFARTSPSYETSYGADEPMGRNGWGEGYSFPCLFRNGDKGWMLISETGVDGSYCGGRLLWDDGVKGYVMGQPQQGELNGLHSTTPGVALPGYTPWRTITMGNTLAPVVETTIPFDVVAPKYEASKAYEYGKGMWSWIIGMDGATTFDEQKRYIDFASAMGYTSILVDALWDTQIGYDRIAELSRYGASKGVALYLWYNSNGYWNDAPQGPRGKMDTSVARHKEMKWMRDNGIRGIKVDFFGGDKQPMLQVYEDILADANEYGLMVIFHGCTLPRGWDRMYPNFVACEAVLASENLHFSQGSCDSEAYCATMHPFVRNTVGSMDFGGSALNKYYNDKNEPRGSRRITSDVFALATAVLFQSPVQHFALAPNNLTDAPAWAIDFMKEVPTLWDETRFIEGYPGKYVVMARRSGDTWYVAGVSAQAEPIVVNVNVDELVKGQPVTVYADDKNLNGSVVNTKADKKKSVKTTLRQNGGFVMKFSNTTVK